jgi:hypothetical protein
MECVLCRFGPRRANEAHVATRLVYCSQVRWEWIVRLTMLVQRAFIVVGAICVFKPARLLEALRLFVFVKPAP